MTSRIRQSAITLGINVFVPAANGTEATKAQERVRRMIYELAGHECAVLREVIASDCKLDGINVYAQPVPANSGQRESKGLNVSGNVGFRVVPMN